MFIEFYRELDFRRIDIEWNDSVKFINDCLYKLFGLFVVNNYCISNFCRANQFLYENWKKLTLSSVIFSCNFSFTVIYIKLILLSHEKNLSFRCKFQTHVSSNVFYKSTLSLLNTIIKTIIIKIDKLATKITRITKISIPPLELII